MMRFKLYLCLIFFAVIFIPHGVLSQQMSWIWSGTYQGSNFETSTDIAIDASGNIYSIGYFQLTVDFNPDSFGVDTLTSTGPANAYIVKFDDQGNFIWVKGFFGFGYIEPYKIKIDSDGNLIIAGGLSGVGDFDPGPGIYNMSSFGGYSTFVTKLKSDGSFLWSFVIGNMEGMWLASMDISDSADIFIAGSFQNTVDFDPDSGVGQLTSYFGGTAFIAKYDSSGSFKWAKNFGSSPVNGSASIYDLSIDASGNPVMIGTFYKSCDFDVWNGHFILNAPFNLGMFITKRNGNGDFLWAKSYLGQSDLRGMQIEVFDDSAMVVTGTFFGTADLDPDSQINNVVSNGLSDIYICRLYADGSVAWGVSFGSSGYDWVLDIHVDNDTNVFIAGTVSSYCDFDPGSSVYMPNYYGLDDGFLLKLNSSGLFEYSKHFGGSGYDFVKACEIDFSGNPIVTGYFESPVADAGDIQFINTSGNFTSDVFIGKLDNLVLNVPENSPDLSYLLYPNPASDLLHIVSPNENEIFEIEILTIDGRVVTRLDTGSHDIDVSHLKGGIYFIRFVNSNFQHLQKLIISR